MVLFCRVLLAWMGIDGCNVFLCGKRGVSSAKRALNATSQERENTYSLPFFFPPVSPSFPLLRHVELKETSLLTKEPYIYISPPHFDLCQRNPTKQPYFVFKDTYFLTKEPLKRHPTRPFPSLPKKPYKTALCCIK